MEDQLTFNGRQGRNRPQHRTAADLTTRDGQPDHANQERPLPRRFNVRHADDELAVDEEKRRRRLHETSSVRQSACRNEGLSLCLKTGHDWRARLLEGVRTKLAYRDRSKYVDTVSRLPNLRLFTKLDELQKCKESWATSSASVNEGLRTLAWPLLELHIDELVSFESLRRNYLQEVSRVCGVPLSDVALHATELFATHDAFTPAVVWLGLACFVSKETDVGEAQLALRRLLNSAAAELASKVPDGAFKDDLYPENDQTAVAAGLVWRMD